MFILQKKCREIPLEFRQHLACFVFFPHTKELVNGLCLFFVIDGKGIV